ncbi:MAG: class I SAM-dependent methyltransferase [Pyrinomonadaceae bacterium]
MKLAEAIKLLSKFPKNPSGVYDEIKVRWELMREHATVARPLYKPIDFNELIGEIEKYLQIDLHKFLAETALFEIEERIIKAKKEISSSEVPFPIIHNGDPKLGRLCYAVCRAIKPVTFIETGVAFGVSSSYILKALEVNKKGKLISIDKPPATPRATEFIGALIPDELRCNWHLYRGASQKLLPKLLSEIKEVNIFLHDSRHTYNNMSAEFELVEPYLTDRSVLIADDINRNIAFEESVSRTHPDFWGCSTEDSKESLFGISIFAGKDRKP